MSSAGLSAPIRRLAQSAPAALGAPPPPSGEVARQKNEEVLLYTQQSSTDFFDFYRRGDRNWDEQARSTVFKLYKIPSPGSWQGFNQADTDNLWKKADSRNRQFLYEKPAPQSQRPDDPPRRVMIGVNNASKKVRQSGLTFKRLLGYGGNGAAALFEGNNVATGRIVKFVAKTTLRRRAGLHREKSFGRFLKRARHIVQPREVSEVYKRSYADVVADRNQATEVDDDNNLLITEFMDLGDLYTWIGKLNHQQEYMTSRALWHLLRCLTKSCIAMAYAPRHQPERYTLPCEGPLITETVPAPANECHIVHFDIDPQNVFISSEDPEHQIMPIFKMGDFGLAEIVDDEWMEDDLNMWSNRRMGKRGYYVPEQFGEQWDYYKRNPFKERVSDQSWVAGNYSSHTNLWSIGLVMQCAITGQGPDFPPIPSFFDFEDPGNDIDYKFWSYASQLIRDPKFNYVDPPLMLLVCSLLAHDPADRPTLAELEAQIDEELNNNGEDWGGTTDADVMQWAQTFFKQPPTWEWNPAWGQDPQKPFYGVSTPSSRSTNSS